MDRLKSSDPAAIDDGNEIIRSNRKNIRRKL